MDPRAQRHHLYIELIRLYSRVLERPWGLLLYNPENPYYYEANGARQIRTDDPEATIEEIVDFYQARQLTPRAVLDEGTKPPDLMDQLEARGFECGSSVFRIMTWQGPQAIAPVLPDGVQITLAERRDLETLVAIQAEDDPWSRPEWLRRRTRALLAAPPVRYYLAWVDGVPAAAALCFQQPGTGLIESVVTRPSYRRRGLATALIRQIQADAETPLLLEVQDEAVERLYTRLGFQVQAAVQEWQCWLPGA